MCFVSYVADEDVYRRFEKHRLFTAPYFFVRSFRYTASYRHGYILIFKCTEGAGVGDYSSGGGRRKIEGL